MQESDQGGVSGGGGRIAGNGLLSPLATHYAFAIRTNPRRASLCANPESDWLRPSAVQAAIGTYFSETNS